jgi:hypothetical protein
LTAKPRTSRAVSVEPRSPSTVEKRTKTGVRLPASANSEAREYRVSGSKHSKNPCAAEPRAWTIRSGMRSWSKCVIFSRRTKSSSRVGPRSPALSEAWLLLIGTP